MFRYRILLGVSLCFALLITALLVLQLLGIFPFSSNSWNPSRPLSLTPYLVLANLQSCSVELAPLGWGAVLGVWIWRGRTKSEWLRRGLDRTSFKLLLQMKGSKTRTMILKALTTPRDKFQLAKELDLDWTTVDYHIRIMRKHDLVSEKAAFGSIKLYELTPTGSTLLQALDDINKEGRNMRIREQLPSSKSPVNHDA